jgi:hypothetical protein
MLLERLKVFALASNAKKIAQFDKGIEKIWGVWCKGIQCSMMSELNTN